MFNFFDSLKNENLFIPDGINSFNVVFVDGKLLYIEGHKGILKLQNDIIVLKVRKAVLTIKGQDMFLKDLKKDSVTIKGNILSVDLM